jgi:hypothetical protein
MESTLAFPRNLQQHQTAYDQMKYGAIKPSRVALFLGVSLCQVKASDYFFAHSEGTYNFNYWLWRINPSNGSVVQTLISGVPMPVGGIAYVNGHLWAHSAGLYIDSYLLWKINPTNGNVVQTLTSGVNAPVGALAYANGYLWAHSEYFNYVLWKINPANGSVVQTLTSGVPGPVGGLAGADGYLWAHSANYNLLWKINPTNGTVVQTLTSGVALPVGALAFMEGTPPSGSVSINGGASFATCVAVNLTLSATDNNGTVSSMRFSNDNSTWSAWEPYATSKVWPLAPGDGGKTAYVQFQDDTGNISSPYSDSITLDTIAPTGSIMINSGAVMTTNLSVALTLNASDAGSGTSEMRFSNNNSSWSSWEAYATSQAWTLTSSDGNKATHVQFRDTAGNGSSSFSDTILFYINGGLRTNITVLASGESLQLSWPQDHTGWRLQVQTNSLNSNWIDWPGTSTNRVSIPISPANPSVFFRTVYP